MLANLKVIVRGDVGLDTIDAEYARLQGVTVMTRPKQQRLSGRAGDRFHVLPGALESASQTASMKAGKWKRRNSKVMRSPKTLGIIGVGNIGRKCETRRRPGIHMGGDPYVEDCDYAGSKLGG